MKKSSFVAMILGTVGGLMFAIGMCMALIPEWNAFKPGVIFGAIGIIIGLIAVIVWRKMEHKDPIKITGKAVIVSLVSVIGALLLGVGMCFTMVWSNMIVGILVGVIGIVLLLCLVPICKGLK